MTTAIAQLSGVTKSFGDLRALRGIDIELPRGITGVLGPNGAGKSTMFRLILGLDAADTGTVTVLGLPMPAGCLQALARIGYMPEDDSLFPELTGLEQVIHAARLSGLPKADAVSRAHRALDLCGLTDARYRKADGFSLGMRQRLRLAMAVVHGPELLLLDEPTAGMDPDGRAQMLALIAEIAGQGVAVLLSTHVLADVETICSHVVVVSGGTVGFAGSLQSFRSGGPGSQVRLRPVGDVERLQAALAAAGMPSERDQLDLLVRCPADQHRAIWQVAAEAKVGIARFAPAQDDMATAFVRHLRDDDPLRQQADHALHSRTGASPAHAAGAP
jgi:ABC-2 type transport system ATP-binding protein